MPAELAINKSWLFVPPDAIYCAAPLVDSKYNLPPAADAVPIVRWPFELIWSLFVILPPAGWVQTSKLPAVEPELPLQKICPTPAFV